MKKTVSTLESASDVMYGTIYDHETEPIVALKSVCYNCRDNAGVPKKVWPIDKMPSWLGEMPGFKEEYAVTLNHIRNIKHTLLYTEANWTATHCCSTFHSSVIPLQMQLTQTPDATILPASVSLRPSANNAYSKSLRFLTLVAASLA